MINGRGSMSQTNEPPLDLESWTINVKLNDGTEFILRPEDMPKNLKNNLIEVINVYFYIHVDHLQGKYGQEIEQAEDLHTQNSERFVNYEKKSD